MPRLNSRLSVAQMATSLAGLQDAGCLLQLQGTRREMAYIYESWLAAGENWTQISVYLSATSTTGTRRRGVKRWLTYAEIERQYGATVAKAMVDHKLNTPELAENEVRFHPDAPGVEAPWMHITS